MNRATSAGLALMVGCALLSGCATEAGGNPTGTHRPVGGEVSATPVTVVNPDAPLGYQLEQAIASGNASLTAEVVALGVDIDGKLPVGLPPLHYAVQIGDVSVVEAVVAGGADIEARDNQGRTPLMIAGGFGSPEALNALLAAGADPTATNVGFGSFTAWHYAVNYGNVPAMEVFWQLGVDLEAVDAYGGTALINAAFAGEIESVEFLIAHGADINVRDIGGSTARGWAEYHGYLDVAAVIEAAGGER